ncbi:hypothetical protein ACFSYG_05355 [Leeuwenhoekiella polynyae]|uniref:Uncharacterized protein n=1 Tax=Leeuwenhoekiella polynyae TaxID=1550906 RepID=A0A4V1KQ85_9FLAO|nr:hypothetical protein [Leeuwenhoekiella polynyae]RXG20532.1 hypothetical protein DSM02_2385 [Leeuwenhoekiella polynyae]
MKIYGNCKFCKQSIPVKTEAQTRIQLAMQKGEKISCKCPNCNANQSIHVNDFKTQYSKTPQVIAAIIFCTGTLGGLYLGFFVLENIRNHYLAYGACSLLLVPGLAYGILHQEERRRVNAFNQMWV